MMMVAFYYERDILQEMQANRIVDVGNDGMMIPRNDDVGCNTPHPESAEALIRMQPLNPYERLEFSPVSFRDWSPSIVPP